MPTSPYEHKFKTRLQIAQANRSFALSAKDAAKHMQEFGKILKEFRIHAANTTK